MTDTTLGKKRTKNRQRKIQKSEREKCTMLWIKYEIFIQKFNIGFEISIEHCKIQNIVYEANSKCRKYNTVDKIRIFHRKKSV